MKTLLALACLMLSLVLSFSVTALAQDTELPTGELARGTIQPVPQGELMIGVVDGGIDGMGGTTVIGGPPGFLISMGEGPFNVAGGNTSQPLDRWGAIFLPGNAVYTLDTGGDWGASFRFIGFGKDIKTDEPRGISYNNPIKPRPLMGRGEVGEVDKRVLICSRFGIIYWTEQENSLPLLLLRK